MRKLPQSWSKSTVRQFFMYFIQHHTVELCRNSSELVEIFPAQIPVYVLHLIPYYANIILQNLYESEHARKLGNGEKNMAKYKFSNKLMFALVMQDEEICAEFIQRLFPGKKVKSITFPNDIKITPEKTIVTGVLSKSVRLDVLFIKTSSRVMSSLSVWKTRLKWAKQSINFRW